MFVLWKKVRVSWGPCPNWTRPSPPTTAPCESSHSNWLFERLFIKMSKDIGPAAVDNKMMEISSKPVLLGRMYFGKHKGQMFRDVPKDYLKLLAGTDDLDEDMRFTVGHCLS